jgi:probable HAF family extracellular repeat protein
MSTDKHLPRSARRVVTTAALAGLLSASAGVGTGYAASAQPAHYPYILVDPGTFGGPQSFLGLPGVPVTQKGILIGQADTATLDSDYPNCFVCADKYIQHAFAWRHGRLTDLGALPGQNSSAIWEINGHGVGVGMSEDGTTDPNTQQPAAVAVLFKEGRVISIGRLPGGYESFAQDINDKGQVAGMSSNGKPDPYAYPFDIKTQIRGFVWQDGVMQDLGTLGGPDTIQTSMNQRGQIDGQSYTNSTPNPGTGMPTMDPFLWQNGHMRDLGSLGGTFGSPADNGLNERGEVVGWSNLAGDHMAHPFLWNGKKMVDLGTLGGDNGYANGINASGTVVGIADLPSGTHDGFIWKSGTMRALSPVNGAPCSNAGSINASGEVVGNATDCQGNELAAVLWRHGTAVDLNTLVAPSDLHLTTAEFINDKGEIVGFGKLPNGDQRVFLLIPSHR